MATVQLQNLQKSFLDAQSKKETLAVRDVNLDIRDGEFLVLVGPSGCGKTTLLRMLAGLETVSSGEIKIGGRVVNDVASRDRDIAMVFQNYALYPHMSVYENMAFGLKIRRVPGGLARFTQRAKRRAALKDIDNEVREAAAMLDITHLLDRKPRALSGGQRQRVALGRAVVRHPAVFLMDEPLSNLDAKLRVQTRAELIKLHRKLGVTTVYVTHDQIEAMTMGQRIAVMKDGVLQQCDTPLELYRAPVNQFVAGFLGTPSMNFLRARVEETGNTVEVHAGPFRFSLSPAYAEALRSYCGRDVTFGIRPEALHERGSPHARDIANPVTASLHVEVIEPTGANTILFLQGQPEMLIASVEAQTSAREGEPLEVAFDPNAAHFFDQETEEAIR